MRSWVPVLGLAALIVFQMVSLQGQIGEIRTDVQSEIGSLRTDMQKEISDLRDDLRTEINDLGARITRIETLMGAQSGKSPSAR